MEYASAWFASRCNGETSTRPRHCAMSVRRRAMARLNQQVAAHARVLHARAKLRSAHGTHDRAMRETAKCRFYGC
eukprot:2623523-Lingulodinium_polyedra.AAC.1